MENINTYHVLNGDSLLIQFNETKLQGEVVICREALIDGEFAGNTLEDFWQTRANFLTTSYGATIDEYANNVKSEFEKIINAQENAQFNLWFGYDLFCQTNLWFILSLIAEKKTSNEIFIIYPFHARGNEVWDEFSKATKDELLYCFDNKIQFSKEDLELGKNLWISYKNNDFTTLDKLAEHQSVCFPNLNEVCKANADKGRPERVIKDIINSGSSDFVKVFENFIKREPIYGFGDLQLKKIYEKVI